MQTIREIKECRLCHSVNLKEIFYVGNFYVSDFIKEPDSSHCLKAPLALLECTNCTLVQLSHTAPQELMYTGHYWYESGLNKKIVNDLKDIVWSATKLVELKEDDVVLDIGANDGSLLSFYPLNLIRIACEPAKNLFGKCSLYSSFVINDFLSADKYP